MIVQSIIREVEANHGFSPGTIRRNAGGRNRYLVEARGEAATALRSWGLSLPTIARLLCCDEATVRYQVRKRVSA